MGNGQTVIRNPPTMGIAIDLIHCSNAKTQKEESIKTTPTQRMAILLHFSDCSLGKTKSEPQISPLEHDRMNTAAVILAVASFVIES